MTRELLQVGGDEVVLRVTSSESDGAFVAGEVRMGPGGGPPGLHRHAAAELYRVERGVLTMYVADEEGQVRRRAAGPGEVVAIPGGREHTIRNESCEDATALVVFAPGAQMEAFIRAAAALAAPGMAAAQALAEQHGIEMTRELAAVA